MELSHTDYADHADILIKERKKLSKFIKNEFAIS